MRWLFLLLLILNVLYYVWHQQQAPRQATEVASLSLRKSAKQDIRLLSESAPPGKASAGQCLYLGGYPQQEQLAPLQQRLGGLPVVVVAQAIRAEQGGGYWLRVAPADRPILTGAVMESLAHDFNGLKHQILPCEGIATGE